MECILAMAKRINVCIGDEQKANSFKGCWWGKTKCIIEDGSLKRSTLFMARHLIESHEISYGKHLGNLVLHPNSSVWLPPFITLLSNSPLTAQKRKWNQ
eukprot:13573936-Ditylum_brightwellii.AAC.1